MGFLKKEASFLKLYHSYELNLSTKCSVAKVEQQFPDVKIFRFVSTNSNFDKENPAANKIIRSK